jgi:hypothetical protein
MRPNQTSWLPATPPLREWAQQKISRRLKETTKRIGYLRWTGAIHRIKSIKNMQLFPYINRDTISYWVKMV